MILINWLKRYSYLPQYAYYKITYNLFLNNITKYKLNKFYFINFNNMYIHRYIYHTYLYFFFTSQKHQLILNTISTNTNKFLFKFQLPINITNINISISFLTKKLIKNIYIFKITIQWLWLALIISTLYFFFSLFYIQIDFTKQITVWYIFLIVYYLIISGFNTFLNKYRYGKFTSAIQRFWKRTGMIFWLIEGFLFLLFFYYFLNSSQEPLYMFDYSNLNQELVIQLKTTYKNLIMLSIAILFSFILLLNINFFIYFQSILILILISSIVTYMLYLESYQFVYILSTFSDKEWIFDELQNIWLLELEQNNLRVKQQYFILCLIAKYWHFIFIFISWFFFLVKSIELNSISITMLGYNTQNLLILYLLNILCLVQWIKILTKKFLEITYSWFFTQYDEKLTTTVLYEITTVISNYLTLNSVIHLRFNILSTIQGYSISETFLWKI